ncbi:hypothetical protein [Zavarzinella formosa]|uniref:hypothetical protein n=1 Tax=Zavarzinella formosa TaxID=360055 RepID=UPI0002D5B040|nr:hypothetical protein [Zavarzinella formosa]
MSDNMTDSEYFPWAEDQTNEADSSDELMVVDHRGTMSPAAMIEHKLGALLKHGSLPVSHLRVSVQRIRSR